MWPISYKERIISNFLSINYPHIYICIKHIIGIRIYFSPYPDLPSLKKETKEEIINWKTLYKHANETDVIPA